MWEYFIISVIIIVGIGLLARPNNQAMSIAGGVLLAVGLLALFVKGMRSM